MRITLFVLYSINITFVDRDGDEFTVKAKLGSTLLEVAKEHDIEVEGECNTYSAFKIEESALPPFLFLQHKTIGLLI